MSYSNGNGHHTNGQGPKLSSSDLREMSSIIRSELSSLQVGKAENALLLQAMAQNWPIDQVIRAAAARGRNWRFALALADKSLQIQGVGILMLVAQTTGADLTEHGLRKSFDSLDRIHLVYDWSVARNGEDPFKAALHEKACQQVVDAYHQFTTAYFEAVGRSLLSVMERRD